MSDVYHRFPEPSDEQRCCFLLSAALGPERLRLYVRYEQIMKLEQSLDSKLVQVMSNKISMHILTSMLRNLFHVSYHESRLYSCDYTCHPSLLSARPSKNHFWLLRQEVLIVFTELHIRPARVLLQ